jgi:hypothetical protein
MLVKLQKKTLIKSQILAYSISLIVGVCVSFITIQLYLDSKPLLTQQSDVFKRKFAVVSKNISVFKTVDKEKIYFTEKEILDLESQVFSKSVSKFNSAVFKIKASSKKAKNVPIFHTDLFFESVPDVFLEVTTDEWKWDSSLDFIPIIIPENYLSLYNFGFAESQGLPVLSQNTISQITFNIQLSGNNVSKKYESKIVGFSNKINSVLVPANFLSWANKEYGGIQSSLSSRLLVEFYDSSDESIINYFNDNDYAISKDKLEFSKLIFFFKSALFFVLIIALIIILQSISFITLSLNLIIQKNRELIQNLANIGYSFKKIAFFYQVVVTSVTVVSVVLATVICINVRNLYVYKFSELFDFVEEDSRLVSFGIVLVIILIALYNLLLIRNIKRIVLNDTP